MKLKWVQMSIKYHPFPLILADTICELNLASLVEGAEDWVLEVLQPSIFELAAALHNFTVPQERNHDQIPALFKCE